MERGGGKKWPVGKQVCLRALVDLMNNFQVLVRHAPQLMPKEVQPEEDSSAPLHKSPGP